MKVFCLLLVYPVVLVFVLLSNVYSCQAKTKDFPPETSFVASTPGDEQIKSLLDISPGTKVDFIRWHLVLKDTNENRGKFLLHIVYGESQPNTLGFKNGGEKKSLEGEYHITLGKGTINGIIYHLKHAKLPAEILLVKLNDNLFHLLTPEKQLMIGNGGWSYTLNRQQPINNLPDGLPALTSLSHLPLDTSRQIILEGRTPCADFAKENNLSVAKDCFKLKWKLVLDKDPKTMKPTTYTLHRTDSRVSAITGKWTIVRGTPSSPEAVVYQLDPDKPGPSVSLLLGDENVAFFLHRDQRLFTGNGDFSYTLNKRQKQ